MSKEVLLTTYKAISKSLLTYCAPIWSPTLSDANFKELQVAQNMGLKTALGCVKMTDIGHIHAEAKVLPVKEHSSMLARQFLLSTQQPSHPAFNDDLSTPPRIMRKSLHSVHLKDIQHLIHEGGNSSANHKIGLRALHTSAVQSYLATAPHNKVLNAPPPEVNPEEKLLPRKTRSLLCQLRSGKSTFLNSWLCRTNRIPSDKCPKCGQETHETIHLFNCTQDPTNLQVRDLWLQPKMTAVFLGLDTGDEREEDPG